MFFFCEHCFHWLLVDVLRSFGKGVAGCRLALTLGCFGFGDYLYCHVDTVASRESELANHGIGMHLLSGSIPSGLPLLLRMLGS